MNGPSKFLLAILLALTLSGCSLIPKKVELFQKKVKEVPTYTQPDKEVQKETADLAARKAQETYTAALQENSSPAVLKPAGDTSLLTLSLTKSLGPPLTPWKDKYEAALLAAKLDHVEARLNERLDKFADKQQENVGKKIEGSGIFQVPYFVWLAGVGLFIFILVFGGIIAIKVLGMMNPAVAVGTGVATLGASRIARGFAQSIKGGEKFKAEIKSLFNGEDKTADTILELFKRNQMTSQDEDIQQAIRELTKK